jgi:hypothetical protein
MRLAWLIIALLLALLLAGVHLHALPHFWYWYYPWLDVPVHFIAGAVMAAAVIGVLGRCRPKTFLIAVTLGALGWEVFELLINTDRESNFILDTSLDLLMDTLGITMMYLIARLTSWRSP